MPASVPLSQVVRRLAHWSTRLRDRWRGLLSRGLGGWLDVRLARGARPRAETLLEVRARVVCELTAAVQRCLDALGPADSWYDVRLFAGGW